jgi:hypothetical protein
MDSTFSIKKSDVHGVGVFANKDIPANTFLFKAIETNPLSTTRLGSKVNHSESPNIKLVKKNNDGWWARSIVDIKANNEVTSNYNKEKFPVDKIKSKSEQGTRKHASILEEIMSMEPTTGFVHYAAKAPKGEKIREGFRGAIPGAAGMASSGVGALVLSKIMSALKGSKAGRVGAMVGTGLGFFPGWVGGKIVRDKLAPKTRKTV